MRISDWSSDVCSSDLDVEVVLDACDLVARVDADLLADALGDLDHDLGVLTQERLGVLPALAELLALVGVPSARLLHEAEVDTDVEERALAADALAVHDVELGLTERRGALVLHHLDPGAVAHDLGAVLQGLDAADVEADRAVELQRPAARRGLGRPEHHADLLPQLVDEDADGLGLAQVAGELRSEEHTSELQSLMRISYAVFCLKKKKDTK